jgi:hypothetical protein
MSHVLYQLSSQYTAKQFLSELIDRSNQVIIERCNFCTGAYMFKYQRKSKMAIFLWLLRLRRIQTAKINWQMHRATFILSSLSIFHALDKNVQRILLPAALARQLKQICFHFVRNHVSVRPPSCQD